MAKTTAIGWAGGTWNVVPGWPGFRVSTDGRIVGPSGRLLRPRRSESGHLYVTARLGGRGAPNRKLFVHRAVLLAFVGPCPPEHEGRHLDGNPEQNDLSNLAWGTRLDQRADDRRNGVVRTPRRVTDRIAAEILSLRGTAASRAIGFIYGVSHTTVLKIWRGESWTTWGPRRAVA